MLWCRPAVWHHPLQRWQRLLAGLVSTLWEQRNNSNPALAGHTAQNICCTLCVGETSGLQYTFGENFSVASGFRESSTFIWCLFWVLEIAGRPGRQLESSAMLHISASTLSKSTYQSFQVPYWNIAIDSDHMFVFVSSKIRAYVKHYQRVFCSCTGIS